MEHKENIFYGTLKRVVKTENGYRLEDFDSEVDRTFYRVQKNRFFEIKSLKQYGTSNDINNIFDGNIVLDSDTLVQLNEVIKLAKKDKKY